MSFSSVLDDLDAEIAKLRQARALLSEDGELPAEQHRTRNIEKPVSRRKHKMTPEGRKRIAEAVKRRWAAQKKTASK